MTDGYDTMPWTSRATPLIIERVRYRIDQIAGQVMLVNSFVVHGPDGLVVVDGMLTTSDAALVRQAIDDADVPLAGVVITHPHPDHYAGLAHIVGDHELPIIATSEVAAVIRRDDEMKEAIVGPMMGPEWPKRRLFPNQTVGDSDTVTLGGLTCRVRSLGPGESFADTIWELDDGSLFVGDVAYNGMHAFLADGQWPQWLDVVDRLDHDLPSTATLHVGHGPPGDKGVLAAQRRYIETFVEAVRRHATAVADGNHGPVLDELRSIVTSEDLLFLADLSIDPILAQVTTDS
jgi:glyoxylase-like metal-dependent hydrolase (beta-lactamase superfamily II)